MSYWQDPTPWDTLANPAQFGAALSRNGDGILLFPGDHNGTAGGAGSPPEVAINGPVVSIRLKQIRDGLEDWEMLRLADSLGGSAFARSQVARVYTRFGARLDDNYTPAQRPWETDDAVLLDARAQIARKIEHLQDPTHYPDPEAATPTVADAGTTDASAPLDDLAAPAAVPVRNSGCTAARAGQSWVGWSMLAWIGVALGWRRSALRKPGLRRISKKSLAVDQDQHRIAVEPAHSR